MEPKRRGRLPIGRSIDGRVRNGKHLGWVGEDVAVGVFSCFRLAPMPAKRLNPAFEIEAVPHVTVTQFMAAVPKALLRVPVASLIDREVEIGNALDMVLVGFGAAR